VNGVDSRLIFFFYLLVKYAAYTLWCYFGMRWLIQKDSFRAGMGLGFLRLLLGAFFGVGIFIVGGMLHLEVPTHPVLMYFSIYAPVRYVEWTILLLVLRAGYTSSVPAGLGKRQAWILGGILISHVADLPLILTSSHGTKDFLPVGRFLC